MYLGRYVHWQRPRCRTWKAQVRQKQRSARFQCFSRRICGIAIIATLKHCIMTSFNSNQTVKGKGWVPNIMVNVPKISAPSVFTVSLKRRHPSRSSGGATGPPNALNTSGGRPWGSFKDSDESRQQVAIKWKYIKSNHIIKTVQYSRGQNGKYQYNEVFGAVVTIPSEWPCKVSGDFVAIHRSRHQDDLWHCWVVFVMAQHQPQGSDAAENNCPCLLNQPFCQPSQTKMLSSCNTKCTKIIPNPCLYVLIFHQHAGDHQTQKEVNVLISCRRRGAIKKSHEVNGTTASWWLRMMNRGAMGIFWN